MTTENGPLLHPETGHAEFGWVPALMLGGMRVNEAPIHLYRGRHVGPNRGHGARHIWEEHWRELRDKGFTSEKDVPRFLSLVLKERTPLYYEGGHLRRTCLLAVRSRNGTAILELRQRNEGDIWTIVTAFSGTRTHGALVGTVRLSCSQ